MRVASLTVRASQERSCNREKSKLNVGSPAVSTAVSPASSCGGGLDTRDVNITTGWASTAGAFSAWAIPTAERLDPGVSSSANRDISGCKDRPRPPSCLTNASAGRMEYYSPSSTTTTTSSTPPPASNPTKCSTRSLNFLPAASSSFIIVYSCQPAPSPRDTVKILASFDSMFVPISKEQRGNHLALRGGISISNGRDRELWEACNAVLAPPDVTTLHHDG